MPRSALLVCEDRHPVGEGPARKLVAVPNGKTCGVPTQHVYVGLLPQKNGARAELWACSVCSHRRPWGYVGFGYNGVFEGQVGA